MTAQLLEGQTAQQLWADRFEGAEERIFELQDQVATQVLTAISRLFIYQNSRERSRDRRLFSAHTIMS